MKFAQNFQHSLERGEYPQDWVDSAIAYRKLKKCIKKVRQELNEFGLDRDSLEALWKPVDGAESDHETDARFLRYALPNAQSLDFTPKLTISIDPRDGSPMDAWLSTDTRAHLRRLVEDRQASRRSSVAAISVSGFPIAKPTAQAVTVAEISPRLSNKQANGGEVDQDNEEIETIEVPLTADLEFFQILRRQLNSLEQLQKKEQEELASGIVELGHELQRLKSSHSKKSRANIDVWREIFRQYTESQIFFSSHEQDAGPRDAAHAQKQLQDFVRSISSECRLQPAVDKLVGATVDRFLKINLNLLRLVKFQELNRTAVSKILKKFNKQTALQSRDNQSQWLTNAPFVAQNLARATCYTISDELLQVIPALDDYLCPICFSISFKPVRLRCNHVFCIRCLVVMQRDEQNHCPLCREETVMEASSENLDRKLDAFLRANFPKESKEKQKANEFAAGVDRFGESFQGTHKCAVM